MSIRDIEFKLGVETARGERHVCTFLAEAVIDDQGAFAIIKEVFDENGYPIPFTEVDRAGRRAARIRANQIASDIYKTFSLEY